MPDFWEFPTVSMGLGPLGAIFQARMNRYMEARGIADTSASHVWAFLGDGEMDEPESLGQLSIAAREGLDNLTFVVNCNLQRLDGPVRGNGKIIQELESQFRGAGWNVIKLVWDRSWDPLLAQDRDGLLVNKLNTTPDGQFQTYATETGSYIREHFFGSDQRLRSMVENMSDDQILHLGRGGHDHRKIYAAFAAAKAHKGQPTVILAQTVKGWTLGPNFEGRNATHQMKKLTVADLKASATGSTCRSPTRSWRTACRRTSTPAPSRRRSSTCTTAGARSAGTYRPGWCGPSRFRSRPTRPTRA